MEKNSNQIVNKRFTTKNLNNSKEEIKKLTLLRIIKRNLVHIQGLPNYLINEEILRKYEYLGQYGKIERIIVNMKNDPELNKKTFSIYVTYNSDIEAAYSILALDSLLIGGKIIRAFFGTTKYCKHFLNKMKCKNEGNCIFLHSFADKENIIGLDSDFGYNEHINLAKKIIGYDSFETKKKILNQREECKEELIFPSIKEIYLREKERDSFPQNEETISDFNFYINNAYINEIVNPENIGNINDINFFNRNFILPNCINNNTISNDDCNCNFINIFNCYNIRNIINLNSGNSNNNYNYNGNIICNNIGNFNCNYKSNKSNNTLINNSTDLIGQEDNLKFNVNFFEEDKKSKKENELLKNEDNIQLKDVSTLLPLIFSDFVKNVLNMKSFFYNKSNKYLKKIEFIYLSNYLKSIGLKTDILEGCLDSINYE